MTMHKLCFVYFALLLTLSGLPVLAQQQITDYKQAVDDVNCVLAKKMLISFERASLARGIKDCTYEAVVKEVRKVQENKTKGYKQDILDILSKVNNYKTKVDNPSEYVLFETTLDNLATLAVQSYSDLCDKYAKSGNSICKDFNQTSASLEQEVAVIVNNALLEIGQNTYGGEKAKTRPAPDKPQPRTVEPAETGTANQANDGQVTEVSDSSKPGTGASLASVISTIVLVLLIAAVGWLYKEQQELKEQLEDIKMMLRVFNQKRPDGMG
ncbi:hypothetical protein B6N25_05805 [Sphingobacteriales bacterium TSM_CSS]|nr:hypothetical protein B6N25_05805 [Sphingobacteriales bacterium TSM_CSS]